MPDAATVARTPKPEPDWELVLKRNPVERIKRDKDPLGIRDELPALIAAGYEAVAEEDIVRLQWWGLYHDKPKIGRFMLRVKLPSGQVEPDAAAGDRRGLRALRPGRRGARHTAERPAPLARAGLAAGRLRSPRRGRALDRRRLRRHGAQHHRLPGAGPRARRAVRRLGRRRGGGRVLLRQPRLLRPAAQAQDHDRGLRARVQRARDQLHRARRRDRGRARGLRRARRRRALVRAAHRARPGRLRPARRRRSRSSPRSSTPGRRTCATGCRGSRRASSSWSTTSGPKGMRERVEARLGHRLEDYQPAELPRPVDHLGVHAQKQDGLSYVGVPVHLGLVERGPDGRRRGPRGGAGRGHPHHAPAELHRRRTSPTRGSTIRRAPGGDRLPAEPERPRARRRSPARASRTATSRSPRRRAGSGGWSSTWSSASATPSTSSACSSTAARTRARSTGSRDIGFQGTTARDDDGKRRQAYDIFVRGGLGPEAQIGTPLFRRVPTEELDAAVEGLVAGWLDGRAEGESFSSFAQPADATTSSASSRASSPRGAARASEEAA